MHPQDVAAHVSEGVDVLADKLASMPSLGGPPRLEGTSLTVPFIKEDLPLVDHALGTSLVLPNGQTLGHVHRVPLLGQARVRRELVLSLDVTNFDSQPPTAELLLPDGSPLPPGDWPKSIAGEGIVPNHKDYNRPFFCRRGLREYHSHPQHEDNPWDKYRETLALHQIVIELLHDLQHTWIGR